MFNSLLQLSSKRVGIVAANHTGYVKALFECMEAGAVAVPLRETDDRYRLEAAGVEQIIVPAGGEAWMQPSFTSIASDELALIAFTSGTEGFPKGVTLTHRNLGSVIQRLNALMQVDDSISEYVGVPVCHSFGFGRCRAVAAVGGRFFIPGQGFNPAEIGGMLRKSEINAISAVPSLWRVLLANQDLIGSYGKRVRWIEIGSQYMSRSEKEALKALFPAARIVQHYGLTEASRTTLLEVHAAEGDRLESVGRSFGDVEVKLLPDQRIAIRGSHVASQYLIDGQTAPISDEEGWFVTKDLGEISGGDLYYKGRADDVINCGGIKVPPEALEAKIYASLGCSSGLAVCRKPDRMRGEGFLIAVTPAVQTDRNQLREAVLRSTQAFGVNAANAIAIVEVDELPKTASGKVQRRKLTEWYVAQQTEPTEPEDAPASGRTPVQAVFCQTLNLRQIDPSDTFVSLGGDSLSYVQLSMALERCLGYMPEGWENLTLAELEQHAPQQRRTTAIETSIFFRAFAILGVVINHAGLVPSRFIQGGAFLLLLIAGANFARFQGGMLMQGKWMQSIGSLLRNLLVPYFVVVLGYQLYTQEINLPVLLLVSNFVDPSTSSIFPVWFIQVLAQLILIVSLLFSVQAVRRLAIASEWRFGVGLLAIGAGLHLLAPFVWNTDHLYNRLPHMMIWLFGLGWCIQFSQTRTQKMVTSGLAAIALLGLTGPASSKMWWGLVGSMAILWQQYVTIPKPIKTPIQTVSAAAYHIYLTHMIWIHVLKNMLGIDSPLLHAVVAVLAGIAVWLLPQQISAQVTRMQRLPLGKVQA